MREQRENTHYTLNFIETFRRKMYEELRACNKKNNRIASYRIIIYLLEVPGTIQCIDNVCASLYNIILVF